MGALRWRGIDAQRQCRVEQWPLLGLGGILPTCIVGKDRLDQCEREYSVRRDGFDRRTNPWQVFRGATRLRALPASPVSPPTSSRPHHPNPIGIGRLPIVPTTFCLQRKHLSIPPLPPSPLRRCCAQRIGAAKREQRGRNSSLESTFGICKRAKNRNRFPATQPVESNHPTSCCHFQTEGSMYCTTHSGRKRRTSTLRHLPGIQDSLDLDRHELTEGRSAYGERIQTESMAPIIEFPAYCSPLFRHWRLRKGVNWCR